MRKAFDANVPKFRPRLKSAVPDEAAVHPEPLPVGGEDESTESAAASPALVTNPADSADANPAAPPPVGPALVAIPPGPVAADLGSIAIQSASADASSTPTASVSPSPSPAVGPPAPEEPMIPLALSVGPEVAAASAAAPPPPPVTSPSCGAEACPQPGDLRRGTSPRPTGDEGAREDGEERHAPIRPRPTGDETSAVFTEASDVQSRRERLLQVKRKVEAAARPAPTMPALPETSARAGESALALVRDLEGQLDRARAVEVALRADLDQARAELGRGAADSRRTGERLAAMEQQVEEKRAVLKEMLGEMSALEEERDSAVGRAQALAALDEERQALLDGLSTRAEQAEKARADAEEELERLGAEFDERASDAARLRAALAQVTQERDDLARELAEARRELAELADARKALEQVHEALASARARLG